MKKGGEKKNNNDNNKRKNSTSNRRWGRGGGWGTKGWESDLFLPGLRLAISKQPCLRGKPFSCPVHYCVLYSAVLGGAGHCSTLQSCQASVEGCVLCLSIHVCMCVFVCVRFKGGAVKGSQGRSGLDGKTPGLEARAQVHHCRQWKALQKAIGFSVILASVAWTVPQNSPLIHRHHCCTFALACPLPVQSASPRAHPATFNYSP